MLHSSQNGIDVLTIEEDLTIKNVDHFRFQASNLFKDSGDILLLDLTAISYLNSSALGIIAEMSMKAKKAEKHFAVIIDNPSIKEIFNIVKFDSFIEFFPSVEDASRFYQ